MISQSEIKPSQANETHRPVLLTCYMSGATSGKNLGTSGYSYDFVARLFWPLLERWGPVIPVPDPAKNLEREIARQRSAGHEPIHVSFLPFQDVVLAKTAPNIVVPAWEFPRLPDHVFDDNPQNDWPGTANQCAGVLVGNPFTQRSFLRQGTSSPVRVVQVPVPDFYFEVPAWQPGQSVRLHCQAYQPVDTPAPSQPLAELPSLPDRMRRSPWREFTRSVERTIKHGVSLVIGEDTASGLARPVNRLFKQATRQFRNRPSEKIRLPLPELEAIDLRGIVYTSILNPDDGRKNWIDLLTGFQTAFAERDDATLVLKLISSRTESVMRVVRFYLQREIQHRCRVVFVCGFLSDQQMAQLAQATTYYVQTTRAEGNCLPLMNYLAAGRPGVSPNHSAMQDYFGQENGFVIESHAEPAAWPHDSRLRLTTTWGRLVWPSLVHQLQESYEVAKYQLERYEAMAAVSRQQMRDWAHQESVWSRLRDALNAMCPADSGRLAAGGSQEAA